MTQAPTSELYTQHHRIPAYTLRISSEAITYLQRLHPTHLTHTLGGDVELHLSYRLVHVELPHSHQVRHDIVEALSSDVTQNSVCYTLEYVTHTR